MTKCLAKDFDDEGRMFFCELAEGHEGAHHRALKCGYRRAYVEIDGSRRTFFSLKK